MTEKAVVFFPDPHLMATPADYGMAAFENVTFEALDGTRLHGWYVPGPDDRAVLLWFHGNAGNISHRLDNLKRLHETLQIGIFLFDYRGYGQSEGTINKAGTISDAEGAFRYLRERKSYRESQILLFGRSLGTALAVHLAARRNTLGMVLESAFTSTDDMTRRYFPDAGTTQGGSVKYDSLSQIGRVRCPILFIHGEQDWVIPREMAESLFHLAPDPKFFYLVHGAGHNDTYLVGGAGYFKRWRQFVRSCLERAAEAG